MTDKFRGEVLSPAGNSEMLYAAVRSGADAVYLGAKDFSARRNAENFDMDELKEAIRYCHIRGVKVYLTLNILIKDNELGAAFELAKSAHNFGIDGIIIADLGLAKILKDKIPDIKLHASTQMSVHSPSALPLLKDMGFCQVVAAREMSREELKALCQKANELEITVEVFVHGALCMSVSGQCLLSAFLGSRSGNRGLCAGPCRLPFKVKGGTGYDLSLKDISHLEYIRELYDIGVRSFKIEGRMKRPEYVAAATAACRQALDNGQVENGLNETLKNVFSRSGFTAGYYENKLGRDMFGIRTKEDVLAADDAFPRLHELYRKERSSVGVGVKAEILRDKPIRLTLSDKDGNTAEVSGAVPKAAQNKPLTEENALKNICKFGGTPYFDESAVLRLDDGLFVPAGELNELRRKAVGALDNQRGRITNAASSAEYSPSPKIVRQDKAAKLYARFENTEQIPDDLSDICAIILPLEEDPSGADRLELPLIADIPRGIISEANIKDRLSVFRKYGCNTALCGNLAAVEIARRQGFEILGDWGLNIANCEALNQLKKWGVSGAIISPEQELSHIAEISSPIKTGLLAYGNIPLMLFKNCPLKNGITCNNCDKSGVITDRLGTQFPVRCRMGYSEMLNSVPIWLADRINELTADFLVLYFTRESRERAGEVINAYRKGLAPDVKHTRGLYYRGII